LQTIKLSHFREIPTIAIFVKDMIPKSV